MAAKVWSRTVGDANWSTGANWNGGTVPVTTDTVTFDGTSVLACTVDNVGTFTGSITVAAGYTGGTATITQNVAITGASAFSIAAGTWTQAAAFTRSTMGVTGGTWTGGSQSMSLSGTLTFSGGTLTMTSGTCTISTGSFTQTNTPTFSANGGTIAFTGGTAATLTGPNCTFNLITFNKTNVAFTVAAGTTCPLGTSPSNSTGSTPGVFTVNGTVTWTNTLTLTGSLTTASTAVITISGTKNLSITGSLTFDASASVTTACPVTFTGNYGTGAIVTATAYAFGACSISKDSSFTIAAGTTIPLGANPTSKAQGAGFTADLTVTGTVTLSGHWTMTEGSLIVSSTGVVDNALTILDLPGNLNINASASFPNGVVVNFTDNGANTTTVTATATTFGSPCTIPLKTNFTVAAGTTIPLGASPTTGQTGLLTISGTITLSGSWTSDGAVTIGAGGVISGTCTLLIAANFTMNATGTPGTLTVSMDFPSSTARTFAGGGKTYVSLTRTGSGSGALTITGTNTFTNGIFDSAGSVAHTITFPNATTTVGQFVVRGSAGKLVTLQRTGGAGTFTLAKSTAGSVVACDYLSISNSTVDVSPVWYAGANSTNGGGNTNWVFTAVPDKYWIGLGANTNWSTALNWSDGAVPTGTNAVFFDATSTKNCTVDNVGAWSGGTFTVASGYTGTITQSVAMTSAAWSQADGVLTQGAAIASTTFALSTGTFTGSGASISCSGAVSLTGGTLAGTASFVVTEADFTATSVTITGATSVTMTFTGASGRAFAGGGKTYASLTRLGSGSGTLTITGTNTFSTGIFDTAASVAHTIVFPNVTMQVGDVQILGSAGKLVTLSRTGGAGTFTFAKTTAGYASCDYISVSNSTVDLVPRWFAGANSTNGGGNTNWIFTAPSDARKSFMVVS